MHGFSEYTSTDFRSRISLLLLVLQLQLPFNIYHAAGDSTAFSAFMPMDTSFAFTCCSPAERFVAFSSITYSVRFNAHLTERLNFSSSTLNQHFNSCKISRLNSLWSYFTCKESAPAVFSPVLVTLTFMQLRIQSADVTEFQPEFTTVSWRLVTCRLSEMLAA